ncbi:MAG TPA: phenylalanine--tRNA ligase subunit beta [Anaerolineales bacterium]|nr:phenylalanine--tRNA ligase subunit beta [Anaerolineales bacterium]
MKVPISWLRDFVNFDLPVEDLAHRLTMAGLEVEEIRFVGLPPPEGSGNGRHETKITGLGWDRDTIVVGAVLEVMPHPNADRLVLCRLNDGEREHTVLTGAPNLFPFKGLGPMAAPIKVAYAREGARIYDGHTPGSQLTTLKRAKIRGIESYSMACSEKELGISDEHEGVIFLDADAPVGTPLADYMGDAVLDIALTPSMARNANILGVAREVGAITGGVFKPPSLEGIADGPPIGNLASIEIRNPELNPRFVLGLIRGVEIRPSPYKMQLRLRLSGLRPINNIVDATNYAMLEIGEPLHAFDYDALVRRAGGKAPKIITRTASRGERLRTLDGVDRTLDDFTVLVCDGAGPLSIGGVIGGAETEVSDETRDVLLEGAAWNFINIRRTATKQDLRTEASYRFSRGVHPAMAERGVRRGLEIMRLTGGGTISQGLVDAYPLPPKEVVVEITTADAARWLGIPLTIEEMGAILQKLDFEAVIAKDVLRVTVPDHRLDIGEGVSGMADLMEEVARIYGYDRIPETLMADTLPPQRGNPELAKEEKLKDILAGLGLQEIITYRLTTPESEARIFPKGSPLDDRPYVRLANPISKDRIVMRHSLLASVLEIVERNARVRDRQALFEIGPVFLGAEDGLLPDEPLRLVVALVGPRAPAAWQPDRVPGDLDFFDLKGIVEELLRGLKLEGIDFQTAAHPSFHPGKSARVLASGKQLGVFGELHPRILESYDLPSAPVIAGEFMLDVLFPLLADRFEVTPVPAYPPVLEDLAVVVDDRLDASRVVAVIREAGGSLLVSETLFDVYRGPQIGSRKKSLAFSLEYQSAERTLTDDEVLQVRQKIIRALEEKLGASIRA